eukprot:1048120-Prymnesium_polylepis.1
MACAHPCADVARPEACQRPRFLVLRPEVGNNLLHGRPQAFCRGREGGREPRPEGIMQPASLKQVRQHVVAQLENAHRFQSGLQ